MDKKKINFCKSVRILLSVVLSSFVLLSAMVQASALIIYVDEFGYRVDDETKEAVIEDYIGSDIEVFIPEYLYEYRVVGFNQGAFESVDDVTLYFTGESDCYRDALAQQLRCVVIQRGDVDFDGKIKINDVTTIQRMLAELSPVTKPKQVAADVISDGHTSINDATYIQEYLAEMHVL